MELYKPNSLEPSPTTPSDSEEKFYTLAKTSDHYNDNDPVLLFNTSPKTSEDLYKLATNVAEMKLGIPFVICRTDGNEETGCAMPGVDAALNLLQAQAFDEPIALVTDVGGVYVARAYEFYRHCTRPWRISGGCAECRKVDNANTPGEPCMFKEAEEGTDSMLVVDVDDLRGILEKAKHPPAGEYQWVSPLYTKVDQTINNHGWNRKKSGAFTPYIRGVESHSFDNIDELRERQCASARTKAAVQKKIKTVCSTCTFKPACDSYHKHHGKMYVKYCNQATEVSSDKIIEAYVKQYKDIPRDLISYVLCNTGPLPWRYNRYKLFLSVDLSGSSTHIDVRFKTSPSHKVETFRTFQEAAAYLQRKDAKNQDLYTPSTPISNTALAIYEMACQYSSSPVRTGPWRSTSYSTRFIKPAYRGVEMTFSASGGKTELYWTLSMNDIFDGFRHYGHQRIPHYLLNHSD